MAPIQLPRRRKWTEDEVCELVKQKFNKRPCWFQIKVSIAVYEGKDVIACAATGAGKTLTFWIPLLMALEDGIEAVVFVVTPLNLLGEQNVNSLAKVGISAMAVSRENANTRTFKVGFTNIYILPINIDQLQPIEYPGGHIPCHYN